MDVVADGALPNGRRIGDQRVAVEMPGNGVEVTSPGTDVEPRGFEGVGVGRFPVLEPLDEPAGFVRIVSRFEVWGEQ
ncbi:hypothetical protein C476_03217 [Natrinema limicola JCM 13563]|uniref:Uncharacterized protein n=1 Tax=Natrinema limicola JCM 13563 TaxID=1230457 RepID=M0CSN3_9EURY|nr:hypothetical protein C476_03217 [Natrinema limicola JCM 13563]